MLLVIIALCMFNDYSFKKKKKEYKQKLINTKTEMLKTGWIFCIRSVILKCDSKEGEGIPVILIHCNKTMEKELYQLPSSAMARMTSGII